MASREITYRDKKFELSYELINPSKQDVVLILHGWGSNKEIMMQAFDKTMPEFKHIYLDLPGFGRSSSDMVLTTADYVNVVKLFLHSIYAEPKIIMGHSFGGKVSTLLNPSCLVLLSSSGILVPKPLGVRIKIKLFKLFRSLGLEKLRHLFISSDAKGMSKEMYETFKNVVDEEFEDNFSQVDGRALLFWGKEDSATPLWTAQRIDALIDNSTLYPLDGDHFFFLKHSDFIAKTISDTCKEQ